MFHCREKNLEVSKKEAKAKEKKNEEKQAASKDDVDIDHEERLQEVRSIEPDTDQIIYIFMPHACIRSKRISTLLSKLPNNEYFQTFIVECTTTHRPVALSLSQDVHVTQAISEHREHNIAESIFNINLHHHPST